MLMCIECKDNVVSHYLCSHYKRDVVISENGYTITCSSCGEKLEEKMNLGKIGYLLKDRGFVVTDKSMIKNAKDNEFEEVTISIKSDDIKQWARELEEIE